MTTTTSISPRASRAAQIYGGACSTTISWTSIKSGGAYTTTASLANRERKRGEREGADVGDDGAYTASSITPVRAGRAPTASASASASCPSKVGVCDR